MKERKPSFLERLTGTRSIDGGITGEGGLVNGNVLSEKPWSKQVDNVAEESKKNTYAKSAGVMEPLEEKGSPEERDDDDGDAKPGLAIDMYEEDNELIIQSMVAGVTPENLHVTITRDVVTIEGKRVAPKGIPEEMYVERELYWGEFSREITLPFEIDADGAEAVEKYGLLIIRLPRLDTGKAQELKVKSA